MRHASVQHRQHVRAGKDRADMRTSTCIRHAQRMLPDLARQLARVPGRPSKGAAIASRLLFHHRNQRLPP
jgi:hypothetical protein